MATSQQTATLECSMIFQSLAEQIADKKQIIWQGQHLTIGGLKDAKDTLRNIFASKGTQTDDVEAMRAARLDIREELGLARKRSLLGRLLHG